MSKLTDRFGPLPNGIKPGQPAPPGWKWSAGGKHLIPESFVDGTPSADEPTQQAVTISGAPRRPKRG